MQKGRFLLLFTGFLAPFFYTQNVVKFVGISGAYFSLFETLSTTLIAVLVAALFSLFISSSSYIYFGRNGLSRVDQIVTGLRSIPSIAWLPFIVLVPPLILGGYRIIGGVSGRPGAILFAVVSTWPLISSQILHAFIQCDLNRIFIGQRSNTPSRRILSSIIIPTSYTEILQGVRYGASLAFILVIVHEQIIGGSGIGSVVSFIEVIHLPFRDALITTVVIAVSGILIDLLIRSIGLVFENYLKRRRIEL